MENVHVSRMFFFVIIFKCFKSKMVTFTLQILLFNLIQASAIRYNLLLQVFVFPAQTSIGLLLQLFLPIVITSITTQSSNHFLQVFLIFTKNNGTICYLSLLLVLSLLVKNSNDSYFIIRDASFFHDIY